MANVVIPENPEFNEALRIIETKDLVHADVVNPMFRTLLLNTIYLERRVAKMIERIDTLAIDNTYGGHRMQEQLIFAICTKHVRWEIFISGITIMRKIISTSIWRIMYRKNGHLTLSANLNGICCAVYNDFRY